MKRFAFIPLLLCSCFLAQAEVMPPKPAHYFNDYAGVASSSTASTLNNTLENFERETSSQIVVAVFKKMESDSSIEDYTVRVAQSWKVGQKDKDNGAVLFVFIEDRKMRIEVGYGLESVLTDALCKDIVEDEIKPFFKSGDYDGGLNAGVIAILAATKNEYKGTGHTVADASKKQLHQMVLLLIWGIIISFFVIRAIKNKGSSYSRRGYSSGGFWMGGGGGGFSGGGGGGGGGFSGGGGSFGGGGAGGSW